MPATNAIPSATLRAADGTVAVELIVNQPVWASYRIDLLNDQRQHVRKIGEGYNADNLPDRFELAETPQQLAGYYLAFTAAVVPFTKGDTVPYSVVLIVSQNNSGTVPGGVVQDVGQISEPKYVGGITRLVLAA